MSLTSLNLPAPPKPQKPPMRDERCPQCRAGKDRRIETSSFGTHREVICEECGYQFPEQAL